MPFNDVRENIHVDPNGNSNNRIVNETLSKGRWQNLFGNNIIANETFEELDDVENQQKYILMAVNGPSQQNIYQDHGISSVKLTGVRPIEVTEIEEGDPGEAKMWSSVDTWNFDPPRIPQDGDEIVIDSIMNVILDIPASEAPKLVSLEVNGRLTFLEGDDRAIRAHKIWVRAGELNIGTADAPFPNNAEIQLLGDNTEYFWSFSRAVEIGNKNLVITGDVNMYGLERPVVRQRLLETAYAGQDEIKLA